MRSSTLLWCGAALFAITASNAATAQAVNTTAAQQQTAQLLSPLTTLLNSDAGRTVLSQNLTNTIAINNQHAYDARHDLAVSDNAIIYDGRQFTSGLGSTLDAAYQKAVAAGQTSGLQAQIQQFTNVTLNDAGFGKYFFANGTTNGTVTATGITLPAGAQLNVFDKAYGVATTQPGQDIYGDSRPFQVAPGQIQNLPTSISAGLVNSPAFPSGHTTFGTTVALLEAIAVPERFQSEVARGLDYGYSRVVLGVHYTLDVIAGRILALHDVANLLNNNPDYTGGSDFKQIFSNFQTQFRSTLTQNAGTSIAAAAAAPDTGPFASAAQTAADAEARLTYGLTFPGDKALPPVVPLGSEVLLSTRFGYLTADERRQVIASTELASGGPLDDGSGWARIDIYKAGAGFGSFAGQTVINQDASQGGFFAADTFSNDIGGAGGFSHTGTGTLTFTGNNSFTGDVTIAGGKVIAGSTTALGKGDVLLTGGTLEVAVPGLQIGGNFTEFAGGLLQLDAVGATPDLVVAGLATLDGSLAVNLAAYGTQAGEYELIGYGSHNGQFANVSYTGLSGGYMASLIYRAGGLFVDVTPGAVPEPASWATMLAGFALVGGAMRRRGDRRTLVQAA